MQSFSSFSPNFWVEGWFKKLWQSLTNDKMTFRSLNFRNSKVFRDVLRIAEDRQLMNMSKEFHFEFKTFFGPNLET